MALRQVVTIDEDRCSGCGECVPACAEGAIQIIDGVAKLVADNLCDGLGACLGDCPEDAITLEEREADSFDEEAVEEHMKKTKESKDGSQRAQPISMATHRHAKESEPGCGCPSARVIQFDPPHGKSHESSDEETSAQPSELRQWPIQLHLVPPTAPYFKKADVILAADCIAFSMGNFHRDHLKGRALAVACPKLDQGMEIYLQKLVAMIDEAEINTLTVMIMEVPCCTGLSQLAGQAAAQAKRKVPVKQIVVNLRGDIITEEWI